MPNWPHAPTHQLTEAGAYMVTSGTYLKEHYFREPRRVQFLHYLLLDLSSEYGWKLEAWAVFSNHYHFVGHSPDDPAKLSELLSILHTVTAEFVNRLDDTPGRQVWFNFWDSHITYQRSYLARLKYVHTNAVHHQLVQIPTAYPWCSAAWFERTATSAFQRSLAAMKIDKLNVLDDFSLE